MFNKIMVHGGIFHADDVFCVALMKLINPTIDVERVLSVPSDLPDDVVVADIGGGKFDHHQIDSEMREDGNKHAACGLIYKYLCKDLFPSVESYEKFNREFIIPIEDQDNAIGRNPLSTAISSMNPTWDSTDDVNSAFNNAVLFVMALIEKELFNARSVLKGVDIVEASLSCREVKEICVLPQFVPWSDTILKDPDAKFVIFPSNRGGYNVQTISEFVDDQRVTRMELPASWLEPANKPEGCTFVHPGRFIAAFETEESAIKAAKSII